MTVSTERPRRRAQNQHVAANRAAHLIAEPYRAKLGELNATLSLLRGHHEHGADVRDAAAKALEAAEAEAMALRRACESAGIDPTSHSLIGDIDRAHRHLIDALAALRSGRR